MDRQYKSEIGSLLERVAQLERENDVLRKELERLRGLGYSAANLLLDYRVLQERVVGLEDENKRLKEFFDASMAIEDQILDFDLHVEATERLRAAREAVLNGRGSEE